MFERAQSENIGVILLTAVITLTITGAGAVVLSEWQADIEEGPMADIESEVTPINATLEHRGGDTLSPNETTIRLAGVDEEVTLSDPFAPGTSLTENFTLLDGRFELLVIHDPTETVVHSETYDLDPTLEELAFEIASRSDPAYVLKDRSANYTVEEVFEVGATRGATDEATITVEDNSKLDVNESASTITGRETGTVNATAEVGNESTETAVRVLESEPPLNVETLEANATSLTSANVSGRLTSLGGLPEVDLGLNYWSARTFNGFPGDNGDDIVADGEFYTDETPTGYTHDDDYIHDNTPFEPGENRTYIYRGTNDDHILFGSLRTSERTRTDGEINAIDEIEDAGSYEDFAEIYPGLSDGETVEMTVEYATDGSAFNFYIDGEHEQTFSGLESYDELYFSSYGGYDGRGSKSLRLIEVADRGENKTKLNQRDDSSTNYTTELSDLPPDRQYYAVAYVEAKVGGRTVTDTGRRVSVSTDSPTVETVDTTVTGVTRINATGNLTDLGAASSAPLAFEYRPVNRTFINDPTDNSDKLITPRPYIRSDEPNGYAHNGDFIHDNVPFVPGESRTYYIYAPESGDLFGYLRTTEQTDANDIDDISVRDNTINRGLSTGRIHELKVEYRTDGSRITVSLNENTELRWYNLDEYDNLYFSTNTIRDGVGADSIRLIDVNRPIPESIQTKSVGTENTEGEFYRKISGLEPEKSYDVTALTEQITEGYNVTDRGEPKRTTATTEPTVETEAETGTGPTTINATGNLTDRGDTSVVDLGFTYKPANRTFAENPTNNGDKLIGDGPFRQADGPDGYTHYSGYVHDNVPFEPGDRRTYYLDEAGSGADLEASVRLTEQTEPSESLNAIDELEGIDPRKDNRVEIEDDLSREEIHELEVEYHIDGAEFRFYLDGNRKLTVEDLEDYEELYVSTYAFLGKKSVDSLRLIDVDHPLPKNIETEPAGTRRTEGEFSTEITGLEPERSYDVTAIIDQEIDGWNITDRGKTRQTTTTTGPTVETVAAVGSGSRTIAATGDLTNLRGIDSAELGFEYKPSNRTFAESATNNDDKLIADGPFITSDSPNGYAHDNNYVHDNDPLKPGDGRAYYLDEAGSDVDLRASLRAAEQTEPNGSINSISEIRDTVVEIEDDLPSGRIHELRVEYGIDGETFRFYLNGNRKETVENLGNHNELYVSTFARLGNSLESSNSLRLVGVDPLPKNIETEPAGIRSTEGEFTATIDSLEPDTSYDVTAITDQTVDGYNVTNQGQPKRAATNDGSP